MKNKVLYVEEEEYKILTELLNPIQDADNILNKCVTKLKNELKSAQIFSEDELPKDIVRLNSVVEIKSDEGTFHIQLVLPHLASSKEHKISILTPMGTALFGYAVSDTVTWLFPTGEKQITIYKVNE
jgi:regulator of nucleoside diphosphate kinase